MPNGGFDGSKEAWEKMEAPLLEIDDLLAQFAAERGIDMVKNYHNWPLRELRWVKDGIHRAIHILAADKPETYHLAVVAWQDKHDERYTTNKWLKRWVRWREIGDNIHRLLDDATVTLESWSEKDLKLS